MNFISYIPIYADFLLYLIPLLLSVALLTLVERKVLASIQRRQGPHIVGFYGILQPFADGLKLFCKEAIIPTFSNYYLFLLAPILSLFLSFMLWLVVPVSLELCIVDINLSLLYILGLSSLSVYGIILAGWASNSKYAFLGSLRSAAQMISYEVSLSLIILPLFAAIESFNLLDLLWWQFNGGINLMLFLPLALLFFISSLAETNRSPFDLPEAEAELVSGYNVEYSGFGFAFFFIAEYLNIIFMCFFSVILFFGGTLSIFAMYGLDESILLVNEINEKSSIIWLLLKVFVLMWLFIAVRAIVPRYRYDQLMYIGWKSLLPLSLFLIIFYTSLFIIFL